MRWVLVLLLMANVAMFGWWQGWLAGWVAPRPAVPSEVGPERLKVVPLERLGARTSGSVPPASAAPETPAGSTSPASISIGAAPAAGAAAGSCVEYSLAEDDRAQALRDALAATGARVDMQRGEARASFLVYLPPAGSQADAQRRVAELRRAGLRDVFLMQDGPLRLGISLGLFTREEGAKAMAARVSAMGYETRIAPRSGEAGRWRVTARWSDQASALRGAEAAARFGAEPRDCPG